MAETVTLIPINPADRELMTIMTRRLAPRWMKVAACLAMEGRRVVLVKDGLEIQEPCGTCEDHGQTSIRAFHKNAAGGDPRCLVVCTQCEAIAESRPLVLLERREGNALKGFRDAF